jgi:hypothetical protein
MMIEVRLVPGVGWWFRVLISKEKDWSGTADSMDDAWARARAVAVRETR